MYLRVMANLNSIIYSLNVSKGFIVSMTSSNKKYCKLEDFKIFSFNISINISNYIKNNLCTL